MTYKMTDTVMTPSKKCSDSDVQNFVMNHVIIRTVIPDENQDAEMTPPIISNESQEIITPIISNKNSIESDDDEEIIIKKSEDLNICKSKSITNNIQNDA